MFIRGRFRQRDFRHVVECLYEISSFIQTYPMPACSRDARRLSWSNCGLWRERGMVRTSTRILTFASRSPPRKTSIGVVEWPSAILVASGAKSPSQQSSPGVLTCTGGLALAHRKEPIMKLPQRNDGNVPIAPRLQQILVAGDDAIRPARNGALQHAVIIRVPCDHPQRGAW